MARMRKWIPLVLLLSVSALGLAVPACAQDSQQTEATAARLAVEADSLATDIVRVVAEIETLNQRLTKVGGDERVVLGRQAGRLRIDALEALGALIVNVLEQEEFGLEPPLRADVVSFLKSVPAIVRQRIRALEETLDERREERRSTPPDELPDLEHRIAEDTAWLDDILAAYVAIIGHSEELGIDVSEDRDYLAAHLTQRAGTTAERLRLAVEDVRAVQRRLRRTPESESLLTSLDAAEGRRDAMMKNLSATVALMHSMNLDTTTYRQLMIEATGELSADVLDIGVASGLMRSWFRSVGKWFRTSGPRILFKIILFLLILLGFRFVARISRRVARRIASSQQKNLSYLLQETLVNAVGWVAMLVGFLVALGMIGVHITPFLAGLGVVGFVLGFALQDTLSNFASGAMILAYRPYDVGDLVEAGGAFGKVTRMTMVSTTILTIDNQTLIVPNNKIWQDVIKNVTSQRLRRVDLTFGISYSSDIPKAEDVLLAIVTEHDKILDDPAPVIKVHALGESSVDFIVRPWVRTQDYWDVFWDVTREVKMRFDREGISIPFPQRDVHLHNAGANGGGEAR